MRIEVIRRDIVSPVGARQWLVKDKKTENHYIVSGVTAMFSGWEVLVFPANSDGIVTSWGEVAGGRGITHEEAIQDLEDALDEAAVQH